MAAAKKETLEAIMIGEGGREADGMKDSRKGQREGQEKRNFA